MGTGAPSTTGPVVEPWVLALSVQVALAVCCVLLAGRALAGRPLAGRALAGRPLTPFGMPLVRHPRPLPASPAAENPKP